MTTTFSSPARRKWRLGALALTACGTLLLGACGDDADPPTGTDGDFTFAVSPTSLSIARGGSAPVTATVTRSGGFAGAITGSVEGVPGGVTLTPLAIPTGSNSGQVTVSVADTVTAGTYTITVRANGTGVTEKTATVALTITAANSPTLSFTLNPAALNIAVGSQDSTQATVTRGGGFADSVSFAVTGAPAGMTVTAPVVAASGTTGMVVVAVGDSVAPGNYSLTLTARGTGVDSATSTLAVTVASAADYALSLTPDTINVAPGAAGTSLIGISRSGGFADSLRFSVDTTTPAGITVTVSSAPIGGDSTTVSVAVDSTVAAGTYPIGLTVMGTGVPTRTLTLTVVVPSAAGYTVSLTPDTLSMSPGTARTSVIGITRTGGFADSLVFSVDTMTPAGITVTLDSAPIGGDSTTVSVAVDSTVAVGSYPIEITVMGAGVPTRTLTLTVVVGNFGSFTLTASPASPMLARQDSTAVTINIARMAPHTAPISFAVTGLPTGVTAAFVPASASDSTATMMLYASDAATLGAATLMLTGTGGGVTSTALSVPLTVTAATGGRTQPARTTPEL